MAHRWRLRPHESERIQALSQAAQIPALVAHLLINRGITEPSQATLFLEARLTHLHDPEGLPGVADAAERIVRAVRENRKIVIYGDYDVDGVCGTSVLWACLRLAGARNVDYYIPHRVDEGYGVNADALRRLATEQNAELIVTVDCGISAVKEAQLARELGVELVVTDHHTIGPELPQAAVLVHPRLPGSTYPFPDLCGCGVAFKLAWQICKSFGDGKKASPHLRDYLMRSVSLVAMATIADIVPIQGENRVLVRHGLARLLDHPSVGLRALLEVAGLHQKRKLNAGNIGFNLGPRINAAGRLEQAMQAVELLTTEDESLAKAIALRLDQCNTERQQVEAEMARQAHQIIEDEGGLGDRGAIVVGRQGWHPGVIGIVASRLTDAYHRPAIVIALNDPVSQGSGRSIPGIDLYNAIHACSDGLLGYGGHSAAAGLKLPMAAFPDFAERFDRHCRTLLTPELSKKELSIDAEVSFGMLTTKVVEVIDNLEPHGMGNPKPMLLASDVRVVAPPRTMGERNQHMKLRLEQGGTILNAVSWNYPERNKKLVQGAVCSLVFEPSINEWQGRREVQLQIKDFQLNEEGAHAATA